MLIWCICTLIKLPTFNCEICTFSAKLNFTHDIPLPWKCESGGICSPGSDLTKKIDFIECVECVVPVYRSTSSTEVCLDLLAVCYVRTRF